MVGTDKLHVVILDPGAWGKTIHDLVEKNPLVGITPLVTSTKEVLRVFKRTGVNCLFINISSLDPKDVVRLIQDVRSRFPFAPICLYGTRSYLDQMPGFPETWLDRDGVPWRKRLGYYYKFEVDQAADDLEKAIGAKLLKCGNWYSSWVARQKLQPA